MSRSPLVKIPSFFGGDGGGIFRGTFWTGAWVVGVGIVTAVSASEPVGGAVAPGFDAFGGCCGRPEIVGGAAVVVVAAAAAAAATAAIMGC